MSEYNMTHTGQELDDAIAKVQSGYVFPDQAVTVTENGIYDTIKNIPVKMLDEIEVAVPVPDGYEIPTLYTGDYNVTSNQTLQTAGKKLTSNLTVNVPVPSGYYKLQKYYGTYTPPTDQKDISFTFNFVPKGIAIITKTSIARAATYSYIGSWVWMNGANRVQVVNYACTTSKNAVNGMTQGSGTGSFPTTLSGKTFTFKLSSSTGSDYNFRFKAGAEYNIYAWGY